MEIIEVEAFMGCTSLTHTVLPQSIRILEDSVFSGCSSLETVGPLPRRLWFCGSSVFYNCKALVGHADGALELPPCLNEIPENMFRGCSSLRRVVVHPNVTVVGSSAFAEATHLQDITCKNGGRLFGKVTRIEDLAFARCYSLVLRNVFDSMTSLTYIGKEAFHLCTALRGTLKVPPKCTFIGKSAFNSCKGLTGEFCLPTGIVYIGSHAFYQCSGLTGQLYLSDTLVYIGAFAFTRCSGLHGNLRLPQHLKSIENGVFMDCSGLSGCVLVPKTMVQVKEYAFQGTCIRKLLYTHALNLSSDAADHWTLPFAKEEIQ